MREYKTPLKKRLENSERWRRRYRSDPQFRLRMVNRNRIRAGLEPVSELPPVGAVIRQRAAQRQRDEKGRLLQSDREERTKR